MVLHLHLNSTETVFWTVVLMLLISVVFLYQAFKNAGEFGFFNDVKCDVCFVLNMFLFFKTARPVKKEA